MILPAKKSSSVSTKKKATAKKVAKKAVAKKVAKKAVAKKVAKKAVAKKVAKKAVAKKVAKKAVAKKVAKKAVAKKVAKKAVAKKVAKKAVAKKVAKKAVAKKVAKKAVAKKVAKKAVAKKVAKKAVAKKVAKKAVAKKVAKKAVAKKVAKKAVAKKVAKKAVAKKVAKKAVAKKAVAKKVAKKAVAKKVAKKALSTAFIPSKYKGSKGNGPKYQFEQKIPKNYVKSSITAIPRDPEWIYLYWELSENTINEIKNTLGNDIFTKSQFTLRLLDVTEHTEDSAPALDIEINGYANNWYLKAPVPGHSYFVEYGLLTDNHMFVRIMNSNVVHIPRDTVSDIIDEEWSTAATPDIIHYSVSPSPDGGLSVPGALGSSENRGAANISSKKFESGKVDTEKLMFGSSELYPGSSPSSPSM